MAKSFLLVIGLVFGSMWSAGAAAQSVDATGLSESTREPVAGEQFRLVLSAFRTTLGHGQGGLLGLEIPLIVPGGSVHGSLGISADAGVGVVGQPSLNRSNAYAIGNGALTWRSTFGRITAGLRMGASFTYEVEMLTNIVYDEGFQDSSMQLNRELIVRHLTAINVAFRLGGSVHLFAEAQQLVGKRGHYLFSVGLTF